MESLQSPPGIGRMNDENSSSNRQERTENSRMQMQSETSGVALPDDLACFLQQQKQRQARMETTMRSFPSQSEMDQEKQDLNLKRRRTTHEQDPLSHRIIEKRRRDRMNNCLADLSRLIPSSYLKKGRGRIEKTEIIEMAIKHMKHLQNHKCTNPDGCELRTEIEAGLNRTNSLESFRVGYHECLTETMHFLVEKEGLYSGDSFCVRLMGHLQKHFDKLGRVSTSEIHSHVGRTWCGTSLPGEMADMPGHTKRRKEDTVKSEFSEESGYSSMKAETELEMGPVNLVRVRDENGDRYRDRNHGRNRPGTKDVGANGERDVDIDRVKDRYEQEAAEETDVRNGEIYKDEEEIAMDMRAGTDDGHKSSLYKFKSNIQQRFDMQDFEDDVESVERSEGARSTHKSGEVLENWGRKNIDVREFEKSANDCTHKDDEPNDLIKRSISPLRRPIYRLDTSDGFDNLGTSSRSEQFFSPKTETKHILDPAPYLHPTSNQYIQSPIPASQTIPIFALNIKGSHYVPLSLELSLLTPFLPLLSDAPSGPLHPVTISVNFRPPTKGATSPAGLDKCPLQGQSTSKDRHDFRQGKGGGPWVSPGGGGEHRKQQAGVIQQQSVIKHWRDTP